MVKNDRDEKEQGRKGVTDIDLIVAPAIHAQRLYFGDMCSHLPVQRGATHAEKYTQLREECQFGCYQEAMKR